MLSPVSAMATLRRAFIIVGARGGRWASLVWSGRVHGEDVLNLREVALFVWMKERKVEEGAAFIEKMHWQVLVVASYFPNSSCGSAPTVNMTNTFEKKKSKKTSPQKTQNLMPFPFFGILNLQTSSISFLVRPRSQYRSRCFGPDRPYSAWT